MKWYFRIVLGIFILFSSIGFINATAKSSNGRRLGFHFIGTLLMICGFYFLLRFIDKKLNMPKVLKEELQPIDGEGNQPAQ